MFTVKAKRLTDRIGRVLWSPIFLIIYGLMILIPTTFGFLYLGNDILGTASESVHWKTQSTGMTSGGGAFLLLFLSGGAFVYSGIYRLIKAVKRSGRKKPHDKR